MKTRKYTSLIYLAVFTCLSSYFANICYGRSAYTITKCAGGQLTAYDIQGDQIVHQIDTQIDSGAISLALDPDSSILFAAYDADWSGNKIILINARKMQQIKSILIIDELCGIVYDQSRQKLYATSRDDNKLYVYLWNPTNQVLSFNKYVTLNEIEGYTYGITMDYLEDVLYIADETNIVRCYDANDPNFGYLGSIDITVGSNGREAVGIDFYRDPQGNKYLYTGGWMHSTQYEYLVRTDINDVNNPSSVQHDVDAGVISVAVDRTTGYVYVTTSNNHIEVYDNATFPSDPCDIETSDIYGPADIIVRGDVLYKAPAFYFDKVDVNEPNCVLPGDYITYKITYGPNGVDHNNVVIRDYLPCQVDYENIFDPNYDDVNHTYKWQIGSLSASAPNDFVTLTVCVNLGVEPNGIITNYCEIESDHYCSFAFADTNVCFWSPDILYVDVNAVGCGSGLSWEHADPDLQSALWKAQAWDVNQIRVAQGTFKPTTRSDTGARLVSFELFNDIAIYGGFPFGGGQWADRNPNAYETILSGDIATPNDQSDNSYHVVKCEDVNNAVLDGFTITAGNANGSGDNSYGGGIYCEDSNDLTVTNCTFSNNSADEGGAVCNYDSEPKITNCIFTGNTAVNYGGGILNWNYSDANVTNCIFGGNSAGYGGGIENWQSYPTVTNCTFSGNLADYGGGCTMGKILFRM